MILVSPKSNANMGYVGEGCSVLYIYQQIVNFGSTQPSTLLAMVIWVSDVSYPNLFRNQAFCTRRS